MMNGEIWWVDFQEPRGSTPDSKLSKDSVALCAQITTVDKQALLEKHSRLSTDLLSEIYEELSSVLEN